MDPKTIFDTGKSIFDLIKSVTDLIGNQSLKPKESNKLFDFYLALQEFMEAKSDYFDFIKSLIDGEVETSHIEDLEWQGKKLSAILSKRHFEAYKISDGLDFRVKPYDFPLYELIKEYHGRVSKSLGYGTEEIAAISAYRSLARVKLKRKHFNLVYNFYQKDGEFYVGEMKILNNPKFDEFIKLHYDSRNVLFKILNKIENFTKMKVGNVELIEMATPNKANPADAKSHAAD
jgi:hypothetical protein